MLQRSCSNPRRLHLRVRPHWAISLALRLPGHGWGLAYWSCTKNVMTMDAIISPLETQLSRESRPKSPATTPAPALAQRQKRRPQHRPRKSVHAIQWGSAMG